MQISYLNLLNDIMENGINVWPRGLDCKEVSDNPTVFDLLTPFLTFTHRKYDVGYFKKEFLWKLTADKYNLSIAEHAKIWKSTINPDGTLNSNYGTFFFGEQMGIWHVVTELVRDRDSRKAVIPMLNASHLAPHVIDSVCTESVGFRIRDKRLDMSVHMRSSDVIYGLATDVPTFACLYRLVLGLLPLDLAIGTMTITSMSSHIYSRHYDMVRRILKDPEYIPVYMPYCNCEEAMTIIASRGKPEILKRGGELGRWLID